MDRKGNVKVDTPAFFENSVLAAGIPLLAHGAHIAYKNWTKGRVYKLPEEETPEDTNQTPEDQADEILKEQSTTIPKETDLTDDDVQQAQNETNKYNDYSFDGTDNIANFYNLATHGLLEKSHIHSMGLAVRDLLKSGIYLAGQRYDLTDPELESLINQNVDVFQKDKDRVGSRKYALTRKIRSQTEEARRPYQSMIDKSYKIPYNSKGAQEAKNIDTFYSFPKETLNHQEIQRLKDAPENDVVAKSILGIKNESLRDNFDANLSQLKLIKTAIKLHREGILDVLDRWGKDDDAKINEFTDRIHKEYADMFTNPRSSLYLKMTQRKDLFSNLISCLMRNM